MDEIMRRTMLEYHMYFNCGRPVDWADLAETVIEMVATGRGNEFVLNYTADGVEKTANAVMEHFHLEGFMETN